MIVISWNIQQFGQKKSNNENVMNAIAKTLSHADVSIIIELCKNPAKDILQDLVERINKITNGTHDWASQEAGDGREAYGYIYNTLTVDPNKKSLKLITPQPIERSSYQGPSLRKTPVYKWQGNRSIGRLEVQDKKSGNTLELMAIHFPPREIQAKWDMVLLCNVLAGKNGYFVVGGDFNIPEECTNKDEEIEKQFSSINNVKILPEGHYDTLRGNFKGKIDFFITNISSARAKVIRTDTVNQNLPKDTSREPLSDHRPVQMIITEF